MKQILIHFLVWLLGEPWENDKPQDQFVVKDMALYVNGNLIVLSDPNEWVNVTIYGSEIKRFNPVVYTTKENTQ